MNEILLDKLKEIGLNPYLCEKILQLNPTDLNQAIELQAISFTYLFNFNVGLLY